MGFIQWLFGRPEPTRTRNSYADFMKAQHEAAYETERLIADMKNRHAQRMLDDYNKRCEDYRKECVKVVEELESEGHTKSEAIRIATRLGYGPRLYNPPLGAMVKYIVS